LKYISSLLNDARGSIGGTVYSRNTSGIYTRARVAPIQPRTVSQQANRAVFAAIATSWKTLTQAKIAAWNSLATSTLWVDSLGNTFNPSGFMLYVSLNRNLHQISATLITNAPTAKPSFPNITGGTYTITTSGGVVTNMEVNQPAGTSGISVTFEFENSGPFSPGINFMPKHFFRFNKYESCSGCSYFNLSTTTGVVIPPGSSGQKAAVRYRLVDPTTGYASTWMVYSTLIP
jgi:hypothetical protein